MTVGGLAKNKRVAVEHVAIGHDILGLISSAMYVEPLTIYRELIQNAADAIESAEIRGRISGGEGRVDITIDPLHRSIIVRDNGTGVGNEIFAQTLCAIGSSPKRGEKARGFRGIGRLVGLGYAQELVFRSRSESHERVLEAVWDCRLLKELLRFRVRAALADVVAEVVSIKESAARGDDPEHFFEVQLQRVARLADDGLLNAATVERYLCQVAPTPFSPAYSDGSAIGGKLGEYGANATVAIHVNGSSAPLSRPYRDEVRISASKASRLSGYEFVEIPAHDGDRIAAVAWVAQHEYLGAFPRQTGVRGLRARVANLQVGDERVFAAAFPEERFADWCVGEVHILDDRIVPNGRRDDFEPNLHFANLVNHLGSIGRKVAKAARTSSLERQIGRGLGAVERTLREYRALLAVSPEAYILRDELLSEVRVEMQKARRRLAGSGDRNCWERQFLKIERQIEAAERVPSRARQRVGPRQRGRVDVLKLLRSRIPGGLSASTTILKMLVEERGR